MAGKNLAQARPMRRSYRYRGRVARTQIHTNTNLMVIRLKVGSLVWGLKKISEIIADIK